MSFAGGKAWIIVVALILSLCLNSFFVGAIITRQDSGDAGASSRALAAMPGFQRLLRGLPEDARGQLETAFLAQEGEIRDAMRALRGARRDVLAALGSDAFSAETLGAGLAAVRERTMTLQEVLHGIFTDAVAAMPPAMRATIVEVWSNR